MLSMGKYMHKQTQVLYHKICIREVSRSVLVMTHIYISHLEWLNIRNLYQLFFELNSMLEERCNIFIKLKNSSCYLFKYSRLP